MNPLAVAPSSRACSTRASWASESRGTGPLGPRLHSARMPPVCQRVCQTFTAWAETPSWRATSAWRAPAANSSPARNRRAGAGRVLVVPRGGEGQLACPRSSPVQQPSSNPTPRPQPDTQAPFRPERALGDDDQDDKEPEPVPGHSRTGWVCGGLACRLGTGTVVGWRRYFCTKGGHVGVELRLG